MLCKLSHNALPTTRDCTFAGYLSRQGWSERRARLNGECNVGELCAQRETSGAGNADHSGAGVCGRDYHGIEP